MIPETDVTIDWKSLCQVESGSRVAAITIAYNKMNCNENVHPDVVAYLLDNQASIAMSDKYDRPPALIAFVSTAVEIVGHSSGVSYHCLTRPVLTPMRPIPNDGVQQVLRTTPQ
jgi:hypothetical protein